MSDDEEIERLKTMPPTVTLTRRDRAERIIMRICAGISIAAMTLAILVGLQGTSIASCINENLGHRSAPAARDSAAHITWAKQVLGLFTATAEPPAQIIAIFHRETKAYVQALQRDQKQRTDHPLGRC